ncbi:RNA/RNP complex-1-interacting phosphatase isoform X2 [Pogona vitticeps]
MASQTEAAEWTHYLSLGKRIPGTRFIAFKVPLKKSFEWRLAPNERFSPLDLVNQVREQKEELGLIIDLTYTTRYYEPEDLPNTVQYCKILTVGHEVPDGDTIHRFKSAVKKFLMENQHNDKLIGVHCTHGLNRTGYLVCRYLIDVEGMDPNTAIELFNSYRGHSIERKNYIEDLQRGSSRRRNNHTAVPGSHWIQGPCGPLPNPGFEAAEYSPQSLQPFPSEAQRHFSPRRGGHRQHPHKKMCLTRNVVTCYDEGQFVYSPQYPPQYPPAANTIQQRPGYSTQPNHRALYTPYQQHFQGYQRPNFHLQNSHYSLQQGRYKIDRRPRWNS